MPASTPVRCAGCLVRWRADDRAGVGRPGLSGVRHDGYAQLCGVSGYAERIAWSQHWEVYPAIPLRIITILLDANRIKEDAHAEFNDGSHGPDLVS